MTNSTILAQKLPKWLSVVLVSVLFCHFLGAMEQPSADASKAAYESGLKVEKDGKLDDAITLWEKALELDPKNWACLNHYAWFLAVSAPADKKDLKKAEALALRAAEASGWKNKDVIDTVAEVYFQRKQFAQAVETQKKALADGLEGHSNRKYLEKQLQKFEEALKAAEPPK